MPPSPRIRYRSRPRIYGELCVALSRPRYGQPRRHHLDLRKFPPDQFDRFLNACSMASRPPCRLGATRLRTRIEAAVGLRSRRRLTHTRSSPTKAVKRAERHFKTSLLHSRLFCDRATREKAGTGPDAQRRLHRPRWRTMIEACSTRLTAARTCEGRQITTVRRRGRQRTRPAGQLTDYLYGLSDDARKELIALLLTRPR